MLDSHSGLLCTKFEHLKSTTEATNLWKKWWMSRLRNVYEMQEICTKLYEIPRHWV